MASASAATPRQKRGLKTHGQPENAAPMTAPKPEPTSATYRRCAAAVEKAIEAIQENPALYRGRTARNKLVELAAAAKQLDRLLDGATIDLVNMDPPYNVKVEPRSKEERAARKKPPKAEKKRKGKKGRA